MELKYWPTDTAPQPQNLEVTAWMQMRGWTRTQDGWVKVGRLGLVVAVQGGETWQKDCEDCCNYERIIISNGWKQ